MEQAAHQGLPAGQAAIAWRLPAPRVVEEVAQHDPGQHQLGLALARQDGLRLEGVHLHAAEDELPRVGGPQILQRLVPELARVEVQRVHRAPAGQRAFDVRIVVGVLGHRAVADADLLQVGRHHAGRLDIGQHPLVAGHALGAGLDIAEGHVDAVLQALARHVVVAGDPDAPARGGRGAADERRLLDDEWLEAEVSRADGAQQRTRARADDDKIEIVLQGRLSRCAAPLAVAAGAQTKGSVFSSPSITAPCRRAKWSVLFAMCPRATCMSRKMRSSGLLR